MLVWSQGKKWFFHLNKMQIKPSEIERWCSQCHFGYEEGRKEEEEEEKANLNPPQAKQTEIKIKTLVSYSFENFHGMRIGRKQKKERKKKTKNYLLPKVSQRGWGSCTSEMKMTTFEKKQKRKKKPSRSCCCCKGEGKVDFAAERTSSTLASN